MNNTPNFPEGIRCYPAGEKSPSFVKGSIVIHRDEMIKWLTSQKEKINLDIKESREGKLYLSIYEPRPF